MVTALQEMQGNPVFDAHPSPTLVLDTEFVIRAANRAYLAQAHRSAGEILGVNVFTAFPDNPDDLESDGVDSLERSLTRVLRTRQEHHMAVQRYDVVIPALGQGFVRKYWAPVNTPIFDGDEVIGILHRVEDVTQLEEGVRDVLARYRRMVEADDVGAADVRGFTASATAFVAEAQNFRDVVDEVLHLRRALTSRATIEQAKGIVMSERRCGADAAYRLLVEMSNHTNVRLADVAAALVYRAQGPGSGVVPDGRAAVTAPHRRKQEVPVPPVAQ